MTSIADLPPETVEDILLHCQPRCVAALAQTCRAFRDLVYLSPDNHIWRNLYLAQPFDDPRKCITRLGRPRGEANWREELQAAIHAEAVLAKPSAYSSEEICTTLRTLLHMAHNVPPWSIHRSFVEDEVSENLLWVAAQLQVSGGAILNSPQEGGEIEQLRNRLHTYFGLSRLSGDLEPAARVVSRAYVYSMGRYRAENMYGPFIAGDGEKVNWTHIRAIHHVVSMHIVPIDEDEEREYFIYPLSMPFIQNVLNVGEDLDGLVDWAGVEGSWFCSFCFCDHRDLLEFNSTSVLPEDLSIFENPDFHEVFRTLQFQVHVTHTVQDDLHPTRPVIHFAGTLGIPSTATMTGYVRMTPEDEVRWHFVSGEPGNLIWSSEGVQIGGVRSQFGVLGTWTTVFHDNDDPIGPFWLRRKLE
ncbi:hypothetical protein HGRIS_006444 [Hohenbuehelia grisea]|uniref:F-box domain-containing protein n=1 Tax=Hohenbuehelia grisea TaxID=104357 RepID=A0ABR3JZY2_9AGAR